MTAQSKTTSAVLFDVDGTLVDSNYLHVHAWYRAFEEAGHPAEAWRTHRSIGMDGTTLVRSTSSPFEWCWRPRRRRRSCRSCAGDGFARRVPG